jgi:uncharacterized membrane protein YraQ (UPF0718 family)/copper chaperone CopZ
MTELLLNAIEQIWEFALIVSPWLILGFLFSALIHAFIGERFIRQHLGGGGFAPVWKATVFGIPLPICSCGVIPLAAGLRKDGASKAATMSFLVSTPTTGIDSIFVTYAFLGATFAIVRPISALVGGILVGTLVSLLVKEKSEITDIQPAGAQSLSLNGRLLEGLKYGFGVLPEDVGRTVMVGVLLGGAIAAFLPQDFSQEYLSNPMIAYPLMLVISVPLYVCAIGSVPIAAAMMTKGLMPGAALAFLIAGTATNVVTIAFVAKKFGKNMVLIYLVSIMLLALASGIVLDFLMGGVVVKEMLFKGRELPFWLQLGSLIFFVGLVSRTLFKGKGEKIPEARYNLHVPNMECKHCQMKVEQAVRELPGVKSVQVFLGDNLVKVDGEVDGKSLKEKIEKAGYTVAEKE